MFFFVLDPELKALRTPEMMAFVAGVDVVRRRCPGMTVGQFHALLVSATISDEGQHRGADLKELAGILSLPYSTTARHSDALGDGIGKSEGLGLIEKQPVPGQKKRKSMVLTEKGRYLLSSICLAVRPVPDDERSDVTIRSPA